jgi:transcriptional regulator with XRE-family HTH domain
LKGNAKVVILYKLPRRCKMKARRKKKPVVKAKSGAKKSVAKKPVAKSSPKSVENQITMQLQKEVAAAIGIHMEKNKIGFNEFARRLGTSATQMQKIQKGTANLTLASLAHIAAVMKKKVRIIWG